MTMMIRTLYEVQQKEDETVEEYMLCIHKGITVICYVYLECLPDQGRDLKKECFYHGLHPYFYDALSFAMVELPEREQACPSFDTLYTLTKKLDHKGMSQAPPQRHSSHYDNTTEGRRSTTGG